jgi:hypothetical protein
LLPGSFLLLTASLVAGCADLFLFHLLETFTVLLSVCDKERVDLFGEASSLGGIRLSLLDDLKIVVEDCHERIPPMVF